LSGAFSPPLKTLKPIKEQHMLDTANDLIGELLKGAVEALDIPPSLHKNALAEYQGVGDWLSAYADGGSQGWRVYSQGSFRLGTVVRPAGNDEYDLDAVCVRSIAMQSTTQELLKREVGAVLGRYVRSRQGQVGAPTGCQERKRCWTLGYPVDFHLDVLPAIPNLDSQPSGILLTVTHLRAWQHSDPIAYAEWFRGQMRREFIAKRVLLAEAERIAPESVPESAVKTTLQRVVQVLKVHRNHFFASALELRPASILLTTLAAHVYDGERDLALAVRETAEQMPDHVLDDNGRWLVANPVEPRENFADKWNEQPERAKLFFDWLEQLAEDLRAAEQRSGQGLDKVAVRLAESFGEEPIEKAATRLGDLFRKERERGRLRFSGVTGALGAGALANAKPAGAHTRPVKPHDFYGQ
jgi:hypothetical protein